MRNGIIVCRLSLIKTYLLAFHLLRKFHDSAPLMFPENGNIALFFHNCSFELLSLIFYVKKLNPKKNNTSRQVAKRYGFIKWMVFLLLILATINLYESSSRLRKIHYNDRKYNQREEHGKLSFKLLCTRLG